MCQLALINLNSIDIFAVKLTFEILTVHVQQHSFPTHERVFLLKVSKSSGDTTHHHGTWLTLVLVIAFCLIAQRHYLHRATVIPIGPRGIHLRVISQKLLECDMINDKTSLKISHSKLQQHLPEFNELGKTILRSSVRTIIEFAKVYQNLIQHAAMSYIMVELSTE